MLSDEEAQAIAAYIIQRHTEDIEYLSVWEMTESRLPFEDLPPDEMEEIVKKVDKFISKAKVSITFED